MSLIHKIGLGSVQFGLNYGISNKVGKTTPEEVKKILHLAAASGISVIDTATAYGDAEKVLGENDLAHFRIVSKFMPPQQGLLLTDQLSQTLHDLRVPSLYGYLAHRPAAILEYPSLWEQLLEAKEEGKIIKIGFSLNTPEELYELLSKGFYPDMVQVPYNYFDRRFEDVCTILKSKGCEIHARSAFLQGLFFSDVNSLHSHFDDVKPLITALQVQEELLPAALLHFVLTKDFIDIVVVGVNDTTQLEVNLQHIGEYFDLPVLKQKISDDILVPTRWPQNLA